MGTSSSLSVLLRPSLWAGDEEIRTKFKLVGQVLTDLTVRDLTLQVLDYSHMINCVGGFDQASMSLAPNAALIDFLLTNGVGMDVVVHNTGGVEVWRGFIDRVSTQRGGVTIERGPYMEISNRVRVKYTTKRYNTTPPIGGQEKLTDWAQSNETGVPGNGL